MEFKAFSIQPMVEPHGRLSEVISKNSLMVQDLVHQSAAQKSCSIRVKKSFFAGTSCGLYSTTELKGDSTVWIKEGATTIGNVIINMIDARMTDGFIGIATHGNGVYSAYYNPSAGIEESLSDQPLQVGNVFPNPVQNAAQVEVVTQKNSHLQVKLFSNTGKFVKLFAEKTIHPGKQLLPFQFDELPAGVYYLSFENGKEMVVRKVVKVEIK